MRPRAAPPARCSEREDPALIRTVAEAGSTNDDLAVLARDGAVEGTWLRAERQTSGRGRQGRSWSSSPANLHASTLVRLRTGDPPAATLALLAGVALQEVVEAYSGANAVTIKWPNDLVAGGAKLSGILLERIGNAVIVGFGVNLGEHPEGLDRPATSLGALVGGAPPPDQFLMQLAVAFASWLSRWRSEGVAPVRQRWLEKAHPVGTALSTTSASGDRLEGLFQGLDETGALKMQLADGSTHIIHAGDVFVI